MSLRWPGPLIVSFAGFFSCTPSSAAQQRSRAAEQHTRRTAKEQRKSTTKGKRTAKQISRFFDQRVYASDDENTSYDSRLGLYYRFNKPKTGDLSKDELVLDYSGNDIFGKIVDINDNNIVFSCGSGVTASVLALAYSLINTKYTPTIYDGSWSEYGLIK